MILINFLKHAATYFDTSQCMRQIIISITILVYTCVWRCCGVHIGPLTGFLYTFGHSHSHSNDLTSNHLYSRHNHIYATLFTFGRSSPCIYATATGRIIFDTHLEYVKIEMEAGHSPLYTAVCAYLCMYANRNFNGDGMCKLLGV